jgi:hypothetical protein
MQHNSEAAIGDPSSLRQPAEVSAMDNFPICAALIAVFISILFWPPKNKAFLRRGIDPGFLNLKAWPARIWFFVKGHDIVDDAYLRVGRL